MIQIRSVALRIDTCGKNNRQNRVDQRRETSADLEFFKRGNKSPSRNQGFQKVHPVCSNLGPNDRQFSAVPLNQLLELLKLPQIFAIFAITLLMYTVAGLDPDPSHRREEVNYLTLTSAILH